MVIDRDGAGNPRLTLERPPGNAAEQRGANRQETAQLLAEEKAARMDAARVELTAFDPATVTDRQVAGCLGDVLRILGIR